MSRQAGADYFGVTRFQAAIHSWKELNKAGINPKTVIDDEEAFNFAHEYFYWRVARMVDAMMDVFPEMERRILAFANYYSLANYQELIVKFIFKVDDNLVWNLIRAEDGLTQIKWRAEAWMDEYASRRDAWMFN